MYRESKVVVGKKGATCSRKQHSINYVFQKRRYGMNLWYGLIWSGHYWSRGAGASWLHKRRWNTFYQRLHVQYVSVFTCVCPSLSLHFVVVDLFWIYLDYYLSVAVLFNFSKARSQSNEDCRNPNPDARHKKRIAVKKIYKCLPALSHKTDTLFLCQMKRSRLYLNCEWIQHIQTLL